MADVRERASLGGRRAAVVGGASGIGEAVTRALCESGVAVTFCDQHADAVEATAGSLRVAGCQVHGTVADALDPPALEEFYRAVGDELDIVVNVVGGTRHGYFADSTPETRSVDIDRNYGYLLRSCHLA